MFTEISVYKARSCLLSFRGNNLINSVLLSIIFMSPREVKKLFWGYKTNRSEAFMFKVYFYSEI